MRPTVFDFAHDNGLNITTQPENKNLEAVLERLQNKSSNGTKKRPVNH
jgi:hypothetical protein